MSKPTTAAAFSTVGRCRAIAGIEKPFALCAQRLTVGFEPRPWPVLEALRQRIERALNRLSLFLTSAKLVDPAQA